MKVYLDKEKIQDKMYEKDIKSLKKLCNLAGASYGLLFQNFRLKCANPELSWLLADCLECDIMDIWSIDWEKDARRKI